MTAPHPPSDKVRRKDFRCLRDETWELIRPLDTRERFIFIFLEGGPRGNFYGIFTCSPIDISEGTGIPVKQVKRVLKVLAERGLIVYDFSRFLVFIPGMLERQAGAKHINVKHRTGAHTILSYLPKESPAVSAFFDYYGHRIGCHQEERNDGDTDRVSDTLPDTPSDRDADGSEKREVRSEKEKREVRSENPALVPLPREGGGDGASHEKNCGNSKGESGNGEIPESKMALIRKVKSEDHREAIYSILRDVKGGGLSSRDAISYAVNMRCLKRPEAELLFTIDGG